jgi:hypothetical protein
MTAHCIGQIQEQNKNNMGLEIHKFAGTCHKSSLHGSCLTIYWDEVEEKL